MFSLTLPRVAALGLALTAFGADASAQISVNQDWATVGTVLTITADEAVDTADFGEKKAKVFLSQKGSKKKNVLKVLSWSPTQIEAQVKKAKFNDDEGANNTYDLTVQLKGKNAPVYTEGDAVTIRGMHVVGSYEGTPSQPFEITAQYLTDKAAKAKIGGKPSKITNWAPQGAGDGAPGVGSFDITPHKKLANGIYDLELKTKAGNFVFPGVVTITGSTQGKPKKNGISGTFGKYKFKPHPKVAKELVAVQTLTDTQITAVASKGVKTNFVLLLKPKWFLKDGDAILDENDFNFSEVQFQVTNIKGSIFNPTSETDFYSFTDVVMSVCVSGDRMLGTFSGTMTKDQEASQGNGPNTLQVTKGEFNLEVVNGGL